MGTTTFCATAKTELALAAHCFSAPITGLTVTCSTTTAMTAISGAGISGIAVGMKVTGTNTAANTFVSMLVSQTALTLSVASTGALTAPTFTGDAFNILLIKVTPGGTYTGPTGSQTNVGTPGTGAPSLSNVGTDEVSGTGYTANGFALTNITPITGTSAGYWSFSVNPSWTTATFSTTGANIYNSGIPRLGAAANGITANASGSAINRVISYHDFGGTQTVTAGTFTILLPTNAQGTSILQIS